MAHSRTGCGRVLSSPKALTKPRKCCAMGLGVSSKGRKGPTSAPEEVRQTNLSPNKGSSSDVSQSCVSCCAGVSSSRANGAYRAILNPLELSSHYAKDRGSAGRLSSPGHARRAVKFAPPSGSDVNGGGTGGSMCKKRGRLGTTAGASASHPKSGHGQG